MIDLNDNKNDESYDIYGIKSDKITNIECISENSSIDYLSGQNVNLDKVLEKERMNVEKRVLFKRSNKSNTFYKAYERGYAIYDKLSKIFSLKFTGSSIIFQDLDAYIDMPFKVTDLKCKDEKMNSYLTKLINDCIKNC